MYNRKLDIWLCRHSYKVVGLFSNMCYGYICMLFININCNLIRDFYSVLSNLDIG